MTTQIKRNKFRISGLLWFIARNLISNNSNKWNNFYGINGLTSKCKHRFRIQPYGGAISENLVDHIRPTLRGTSDIIAIHIGTNDITNDDCSSLQIKLGKIRELVTELSPWSKVVLSFIILSHDKTNINVKANRENEIIKQFSKTNKLDLIGNSNIKDQKLYGKKELYLNDAGMSLLANNFIKYFINMWLTIRSDSDTSLPY